MSASVIEQFHSDLDESAYWHQARAPFVSLIFLLPLLTVYELGVTLHSSEPAHSIRNGADHWMRQILGRVGLGHSALLPALVIAGLLLWHLAGRYPWRFSAETLAGMLAESILFAFLLIIVGQLQDLAFRQLNLPALNLVHGAMPDFSMDPVMQRIITYIGAGVYEEFLFRLCLLPLACLALHSLGLTGNRGILLAVLSTGLMFSAAHHLGAGGEAFQLFTFVFRTMAGVFFATLFYLRGFGVTVGCHATYDLMVGVILTNPR